MMQPLVVVVDDRPESQRSLWWALEDHGYRVETFIGGEDFLSRYKPEPGCVLLDMMMPEVDGAEVLRRMKIQDWMVPVIAYCLDPRSEVVARQLGAVAFLLKPILTDKLIDLLGRHTLDADEPFILSRANE
jgi:FixJ family two-component response regulator